MKKWFFKTLYPVRNKQTNRQTNQPNPLKMFDPYPHPSPQKKLKEKTMLKCRLKFGWGWNGRLSARRLSVRIRLTKFVIRRSLNSTSLVHVALSFLLQVGLTEECSSGSSVVGNFGEKAAFIKPTCQLQVVHDHGNQSKGTVRCSL